MRRGHLLRRGLQAADVVVSRWLLRPPRSMPFLVCLVTFRCNLRCRMCDFWRTPARRAEEELSTAEWLSVIDQGAELDTWVVSFTGGETLLRDDLEDLVHHAHRRGLGTHLCTNGLLLTPERARSLAAAGLGSVNVSLDSADPATHNYLRGRDVFEQVVSNVRAFRAAAPGVRLGLSCLITRHNYRGLARMVDFARSLGAQSLRFAPIHTNLLHHRMDPASFGDLPLRPEDLKAVRQEIRRAAIAFERTGLHRGSRPFLRGIGRIAQGRRNTGCVAGFATACVDPYGFVAPCPDIEGVENVREKPLTDIWRSRSFQRLRRRVINCRRPCWDTSYAELSLRFRMHSTLADPHQLLGELNFYLR